MIYFKSIIVIFTVLIIFYAIQLADTMINDINYDVWEEPNFTINLTPEDIENILENISTRAPWRCCYPLDCWQAKYNPEKCDCMYPVLCGEGED